MFLQLVPKTMTEEQQMFPIERMTEERRRADEGFVFA